MQSEGSVVTVIKKIGVRGSFWSAGETDAVADVCDFAVRAEALGFDAVFTGDRVLVDAGATTDDLMYRNSAPEIFVTMSAVAARTSTIAVGSLILLLPYRHPMLVAKAINTLDAFSGGRVILGVGSGWNQAEFDNLGIDRTDRQELLADSLSCLRAIWSGDLAYHGSRFSIDGALVLPSAKQSGGPPVWMGSGSPNQRFAPDRWAEQVPPGIARGLRVCGQMADGWVPMLYSVRFRNSVDPSILRRCWDEVAEGATQTGRPAPEFVFSHWIYITEQEPTDQEIQQRVGMFFPGTPQEAARTYLIGSPSHIVDRIGSFLENLPHPRWFLFTLLEPSERQLELLMGKIVPQLPA